METFLESSQGKDRGCLAICLNFFFFFESLVGHQVLIEVPPAPKSLISEAGQKAQTPVEGFAVQGLSEPTSGLLVPLAMGIQA